MLDYLQTVIDAAAAYPHLVYALVFLVALTESLPVVGLFVPGSVFVVGIGALAPTGAVGLGPLMIGATAGAVAGDSLAYWLGRRYHRQIVGRWPLRRYPQLIERGEALFRRHGVKSLLLGRFTPPARGVVPLVAGIVRMPAYRFYVVSLLAALLWAPVHLLVGALLGASLALAGAVAGRLAVFLVVVLGALWLGAWTARLALRRAVPAIAGAEERLWRWGQGRGDWPSRLLLSVLDPARPEIKGLAVLAALLIAAAATFLGILEDVVTGDPLVRADVAVYHFLQELRTQWGDAAMVVVTELGDSAVTVPVTVAVLAWLAWRRAWHAAAYWLGAVALASAFNTVLKLALHMPRPVDIYPGASAFSFPSGHATVNTVIYGFLALLVARELRPVWRLPLAAAAAVFVALIAFSRLYLGAHWLSDVAGGVAFGVAWVALLGIAYLRHRPPRLRAAGLLTVVCAVLALAGVVHISRQYSADMQRYAAQRDETRIAAADWWRGAWRDLPARRIDLGGEAEQPLTVQWAGGLEALETRLGAAGWRVPVKWTAATALSWLAADPDPLGLPVLPQLHDGEPAALTMIRADGPSGRLVLRLWEPRITLDDGAAGWPLWVGAVAAQRLVRPLALLTMSPSLPGADAPRQAVAGALDPARLARRAGVPAGPDWDGRVLLAQDPALMLPPDAHMEK
ncbi:MAG: VTT domain-containing protein [Dongiaceae bacterium]